MNSAICWMDAHSHIFPRKIARKATAAIGSFYDSEMAEEAGMSERLLELGKQAGIERFLVCSTATTPHQVESIDRFIVSECAAHAEFIGLATMHPDYGNILGELVWAKAAGLRGIKLHPDFQTFAIDDKKAYPIYEAAQALRLPILFHTGDRRYHYSSPAQLARVARNFPDLICIGAHFGGYTEWDDALEHLACLPNVYYDTSSSLFRMSPQEAAARIHVFGAEHMMFGTDFPMWNPVEEKDRFMRIPLNDEEREQIAYKTFARLFGLEESK